MTISYQDFVNKLNENKTPLKKVYFTFGRFQPITSGHLVNFDFVFGQPGDHFIYVSHSEDSDKNPLSLKTKLELIKAARPAYEKFIIPTSKEMPSVIQILGKLQDEGYESITFCVGEDRVKEFTDMFKKYKDDYSKIKELNVISTGKRKSNISATNMREWAVEDNYAKYKAGMGDVPEKLIKKSFNEIRSKLVNESVRLRDNYLSGKIFKIGSIVKSKIDERYFEVIDRGNNYIRLVNASGEISRSWLGDVVEISDQRLKESFTKSKKVNNQVSFKGYTTKHFGRDIFESFKNINSYEDVYAMLSAIKHTDQFFDTEDLYEKFNHFTRSEHYLKVLGVIENHSYRDLMESIIAEKIFADIPSIKQITKSDKTKTANIILAALGIEADGTPEEKINKAAKEVSKNVSADLREIYGSLFQLANDVGIDWDKSIFTTSQQSDLGLIESANFELFLESLCEGINSFNDVIPEYSSEELVAVDSDGEETDLDSEEDTETAIKKTLKTNPVKDKPKTIAVKEPTNNSGLERKAKNLALRYLRDRQLRSTLHKMTDKERNNLENILSTKGSVITNATKKLIAKLSKIESERLRK